MKRVGFLYSKIYDVENCKQAILNAARKRKKKKRRRMQRYLDNIDSYAEKLSDMLRNKTFTPSPYGKFTLYDGIARKERVISTTKFFPDMCVHWAIVQVTGDILRRGVYKYSCAGIQGRGCLYASRAVRKWFRKDPKNTKYCLKLDIRHFYPSINNEVLKRLLRRLIKDRDVLELFDRIIDIERGVPIGTVLSPYFADVVLQSLDYEIKQHMRDLCAYYIRNADDMCIFGRNKKHLHTALERIRAHLARVFLQVKGNHQVFLVERADGRKRRGRRVDFCGYAVSHMLTLVRKRISIRILRTCRKLAAGRYTVKLCKRFMSYNGWLKYADSRKFKEKYINNKISIKRIREVLRNENSKRNIAAGAVAY